jgi:hypothetical protein
MGGTMRLSLTTVTIVALALIACNGPGESTPEIGPEGTAIETPGITEPSPSDAPVTPKSPENTLVETPEYTGVIFSMDGASEFGFLFDVSSTEFWEPSVDDISRAEECIRQFLASVQQDPNAYQKEDAAFILENLGKYRRQYVGIVVDGEKHIWINSFFSEESFSNWTRDPVYVLDGGNHFWEIEYVLPKDECIKFHVHGEA